MTLSKFVADKVEEHLIMLAIENKLPMDMTELDLTEVVQNAVEQHRKEFRTDVLNAMGHYLSNDPSEFPELIEKIEAAEDDPDTLIDSIDGISMWEPLEGRWTVDQFKTVIGL